MVPQLPVNPTLVLRLANVLAAVVPSIGTAFSICHTTDRFGMISTPPRKPMLVVLGSRLPRADRLTPLYVATWLGPVVFGTWLPGGVALVVWPYSRNGTSVP